MFCLDLQRVQPGKVLDTYYWTICIITSTKLITHIFMKTTVLINGLITKVVYNEESKNDLSTP